MLLRSAIAAVNTMDIRDVERTTTVGGSDVPDYGASDVTVAEIPLGAFGGGTADHTARVFGTEAQPFITEVILQWSQADPNDATSEVELSYVGIELINPYPFAIDVSGWKIVATNPDTLVTGGQAAGNFPQVLFEFSAGSELPAATVAAPAIEPARVVLVIGTRPDAAHPDGEVTDPFAGGAGGTGGAIDAATLGTVDPAATAASVQDQAIMIVRPAIHAATASPVVDDANMVPLDLVNVVGINPANDSDLADNAEDVQRWHYVRESTDDARNWRYVFHGAYEVANSGGIDTPVSEGVVRTDTDATPGSGTPGFLGAAKAAGDATVTVATAQGFPARPGPGRAGVRCRGRRSRLIPTAASPARATRWACR